MAGTGDVSLTAGPARSKSVEIENAVTLATNLESCTSLPYLLNCHNYLITIPW